MICKETLFSDHAITQMFRRSISVSDVNHILSFGEIIITYSNDKPFPSQLLFGYIQKRPLHILVAKDENSEKCIIVTAYEPDKDIWEFGFKIKKS